MAQEFISINPATEEENARIPVWDDDKLDTALRYAGYAQRDWAQQTPLETRCELLRNVAELLRVKKRELAELATREMGKRIGEAEAEVEKCAWVCDFYADQAPAMLADEVVETEATRSLVVYQPLGVILAVMPWNFPYWQVFRAAAPALVAGNGVVLKHASNVPLCALAIEGLFKEAGFPEDLFQSLMITSAQVERAICHPDVRGVTLTGSEPAGRAVASIAGRELKKTVLELGGSDPFVILPDADLDEVVPMALKARFINMGQSCIAAKRFLVDKTMHDEFVARFKVAIEDYFVPGDPMDPATTLGPMARRDLMEELHNQVIRAQDYGATVETGGQTLDRPGAYYAPTLLTNVTTSNPAFQEELFGPVATVTTYTEPSHALGLANATRFGLGGSVWTTDIATGEAIARGMQCGCAFVNDMVRSDPRLPFGGIKDSGYGRELSVYGIREFVNIKTLWIK
ncbi:succinate-semialdehyde dehydrogenase / glutarate-semialdehyde dehydrogenase [Sulfurivirga caldicuralii]|uniref:Succinate-semialdehyde dehydrogenase / glutarate-semialdehyde dehydrogenase n=1 Tax=Sulfurivirga caldicuralii TaxID=364032 RepID=A0A1N6GWI7_9GAMM|nr:NAD-dependent succinate-semialdehyde dehydrogenase [Sulfurivirga caldicuralii]SIO11951.1 succinate-semialdehyde dehydrogenase / glutarate-semialdehyde dehydrogenase [Sulfurivirga caldicuralii]